MSETASKTAAPRPDPGAMLATVVKMIVEQPDDVRVATEEDGPDTILCLKVAPADLGRVIGRQGRTARALRVLLDAAASRNGHRMELEILEEDEELGAAE